MTIAGNEPHYRSFEIIIKMLALLILVAIPLSGTAVDVIEVESLDWMLFDSFVTNHSRTYRSDTDQLKYRFQVFQVTRIA